MCVKRLSVSVLSECRWPAASSKRLRGDYWCKKNAPEDGRGTVCSQINKEMERSNTFMERIDWRQKL